MSITIQRKHINSFRPIEMDVNQALGLCTLLRVLGDQEKEIWRIDWLVERLPDGEGWKAWAESTQVIDCYIALDDSDIVVKWRMCAGCDEPYDLSQVDSCPHYCASCLHGSDFMDPAECDCSLAA